jgi:hypothetical protein
MTPQSSFMVVAAIDPAKLGALRTLLLSMNSLPGNADPDNDVVPFGLFDKLHFARFSILDDQTTGDWEVYDLPRPVFPLWLAFIGDIDGDYAAFMRELSDRAGAGLRRIFSHCTDFNQNSDLLRWMREHEHRPATFYFNWRGRTVIQGREEEALRRSLRGYLLGNPKLTSDLPAMELLVQLRRFVAEEIAAGRLTLTPESPTTFAWYVLNTLDLILTPLILLVASPLILICTPFFLYHLRRLETTDPEIAPRPDQESISKLTSLEDYGVTNQFSAFGSLKPGLFRRSIGIVVLWILNYATRHVYCKGLLGRVRTIHSARWVFLDGKRRVFFASHYDISLDSYTDDFINKVAFGLNLPFSNGIGYPVTNWLLLDGAKDEQPFKYFIRRHQLPTEVWYNGHAGLTCADLQRNSLIRAGIEAENMTEEEARSCVALL